MSKAPRYEPTEREIAFLDTVESPRYERQTINGLKPFLENRVPEEFQGLYSGDELHSLRALKGT